MSTFAEIFYKMFEESKRYDEACAEVMAEKNKDKESDDEQ